LIADHGFWQNSGTAVLLLWSAAIDLIEIFGKIPASIAGEIVLLHRGRVIETANAVEFLNSPKTGEARAFLAGELLV
jgi:hypothetical protein